MADEPEPGNFELIEQGLLRLDPETRHHVIQAMLVIQRDRGDPAWIMARVLAPSRVAAFRVPPLYTIASGF